MPRRKPKPRKPLPRSTKPLKRTPLPRPTKPLSRVTKPLERRTPLRRGKWTRATWELWTRLDAQAHAAWKRKVTRGRCLMCLARGVKTDAHSIHDPHHVLPARYLRAYVRALRLPAEEARALLRSLLFDPRNGICLCRRCHDKHETRHTPVPRSLVPRKVWQFAGEIGLEHVIERMYPE